MGAAAHGTTVVEGDTLIVLQLGTSCEDRVVDSDGVIVSQPGQQMNCVPHRAETSPSTRNLPPCTRRKSRCHDIEPPPSVKTRK